MKEVYQRWVMLVVVGLINSELFNVEDWQFWAIACLLPLATGSLFKK